MALITIFLPHIRIHINRLFQILDPERFEKGLGINQQDSRSQDGDCAPATAILNSNPVAILLPVLPEMCP